MTLFERFTNNMEKVGRARTLRVLEGLSERQLADAGISQALLNQGVTAWPWREETEVAPLELVANGGLAKTAVDDAVVASHVARPVQALVDSDVESGTLVSAA